MLPLVNKIEGRKTHSSSLANTWRLEIMAMDKYFPSLNFVGISRATGMRGKYRISKKEMISLEWYAREPSPMGKQERNVP